MKFFLDKKLVANGKSWLAIHGAVALFIMVIVVPQASAQDTKVQSLESPKLMGSQLQTLRSELEQVKSGSTSGSHKIMAAAPTSAMSDKSPPKERHDWTGFYVGGFVGGGGGAKASPAEPNSPTYAGNGNWYPFSAEMVSYRTNSSVMGGGTVGYNWQLGRSPYLVGLEGEYGYLGMSGSASDPFNVWGWGVEPSFSSTKIGGSYGYGVIGGRLGYAYDRSLFYVKSGAVFTSAQSQYNDINNISPGPDWFLQTSSKTSNDVGYAIGGGIEQALPPEWFELAKNISIKAEYLFLGIGRNLQATGVGGDDRTTPINYSFSHTDSIGGIHTAKLGINYRFRGF